MNQQVGADSVAIFGLGHNSKLGYPNAHHTGFMHFCMLLVWFYWQDNLVPWASHMTKMHDNQGFYGLSVWPRWDSTQQNKFKEEYLVGSKA